MNQRNGDDNLTLNRQDDRLVDFDNFVIRCSECAFVAPLALSHEQYLELHAKYNTTVGGECFKMSKTTTTSRHHRDKYVGNIVIKLPWNDPTIE